MVYKNKKDITNISFLHAQYIKWAIFNYKIVFVENEHKIQLI